MSIIKQTFEIKERVKQMLIKFPHLRDDDFKLIANFYIQQGGGKDAMQNISAYEFLKEFSAGKFANSESIRRVRQKIQEENESLRGKSYGKRKEEAIIFSKTINDE
jgi:hypothetical protein